MAFPEGWLLVNGFCVYITIWKQRFVLYVKKKKSTKNFIKIKEKKMDYTVPVKGAIKNYMDIVVNIIQFIKINIEKNTKNN